MTDVLPARKLVGPPSRGLALCVIATLVPTVWLLLPQPNTVPNGPADVAFSCAFLIPQVLALAASSIRHRSGRTLTVVFASLGLALSVWSVPLYGLGLLFIAQSGVATVVAARREI